MGPPAPYLEGQRRCSGPMWTCISCNATCGDRSEYCYMCGAARPQVVSRVDERDAAGGAPRESDTVEPAARLTVPSYDNRASAHRSGSSFAGRLVGGLYFGICVLTGLALAGRADMFSPPGTQLGLLLGFSLHGAMVWALFNLLSDILDALRTRR